MPMLLQHLPPGPSMTRPASTLVLLRHLPPGRSPPRLASTLVRAVFLFLALGRPWSGLALFLFLILVPVRPGSDPVLVPAPGARSAVVRPGSVPDLVPAPGAGSADSPSGHSVRPPEGLRLCRRRRPPTRPRWASAVADGHPPSSLLGLLSGSGGLLLI
ncbi:hypothetical protein EXN66_Car014231 [Channa argus]|uniref:Uncharacterized protein n=1 Tax=Channa argus TaxID=215402 RepID=A0A6G1Q7L3_CHAAH|nr:hypothetical protein EXN66_Car014231 [Channa argus]